VPAAARVLEWARKACGLTVEEAAVLLGCKPDLLRGVEAGKKLPSASMLREMAFRYGFPEATLMAEDPSTLPDMPTDHKSRLRFHCNARNVNACAMPALQLLCYAINQISRATDGRSHEASETASFVTVPAMRAFDRQGRAGYGRISDRLPSAMRGSALRSQRSRGRQNMEYAGSIMVASRSVQARVH